MLMHVFARAILAVFLDLAQGPGPHVCSCGCEHGGEGEPLHQAADCLPIAGKELRDMSFSPAMLLQQPVQSTTSEARVRRGTPSLAQPRPGADNNEDDEDMRGSTQEMVPPQQQEQDQLVWSPQQLGVRCLSVFSFLNGLRQTSEPSADRAHGASVKRLIFSGSFSDEPDVLGALRALVLRVTSRQRRSVQAGHQQRGGHHPQA